MPNTTAVRTAQVGAAPFFAGKNKIINGDFNIWQRGTSFSITSGSGTYTADRFAVFYDGTGATRTVSQQTFTPGTAPVAGYEGATFYRMNQSVAGTGGTYNYPLMQKIEDVRTFAGQTVTFSFWAKADASRTVTVEIDQIFGTGGSAGVVALTSGNFSLTTSWQRFSVTGTLPSISGKTIGTNSSLNVFIMAPVNTAFTFDTWGWQLEAGSVATAFQTATGTLAGELAACQRYCWKITSDAADKSLAVGGYWGTDTFLTVFQYPVTMRTTPAATIVNGTNYWIIYRNGSTDPCDTAGFANASANACNIEFTGNVSGTIGHAGQVRSNNASASIILSAEL